jgi:hypothetical protein
MAESTGKLQAPSFDAFISYRRSDGARAAHRLRRRLLAFRLPKALRTEQPRKLSIFMDTAYERGAADFYDATIKPALLNARWLIIVATPDAVKRDTGDDWIAREVADFASGPNRENIIVVRAKGEFLDRLPADVNERYPNVQIVDLRDDSFLARLSPQVSARFADEMLKVAGPLFGVSLADMPRLRREEEKRQMTRVGAVAGALATTIVATVAVSLYTLQSQLQANRLLAETARVTERNISAILGDYADEEPLDSPRRGDLFNNCELAARLKSLGGEGTSQSIMQACTIEEGAALAQAAVSRPAERAEALKQIETAITAAQSLKAKAENTESSWKQVVRNGFSTLALLDEGAAAEQRRIARADFEAADARDDARTSTEDSKLLPDTRASLRIRAVRGLNRAAGIFANSAARLVETDPKLSATLYRKASETRAEALANITAEVKSDSLNQTLWLDTAHGLVRHVLDENIRLSKSTPEDARKRLDWALAQLSTARLPKDVNQKKYTFLLGLLGHAQAQRPGRDADEGARRSSLRQSVAQVLLVTRDEKSDWRDIGQEEAQSILRTLFESTDAWRRRIKAMAASGQHREAAAQLATLIDEHLALEPFLLRPDPWLTLYAVIAYRDLAAYLENIGDLDGAEAARIRGQGLYRPFMSGEGLNAINGGQATEVRSAWEDIYNGHHRRIDALRDRASTAEDDMQAMALLHQLIAEDEAWDKGMAGTTAWDDIYRAGAWRELSERQQRQGQTGEAAQSLARACGLIAPYKGKFPLSSNQLTVAERLNGELKSCSG